MPPVRTLSHCAAIVAARIAASFIVRAWGLFALSDDDFSRIVISQGFAIHPRLDPSGTSWLPVPFWIEGTFMALFGRSLGVANLVTLVGSCLAALLLYAAARWSGLSARTALIGALGAAILPVAAITGAANVPELPVACCTAAALLLLRERTAARCFGAAALLIAATLSRYEPWPVAFAAAVIILLPSPRVDWKNRIGAAAIAVAGPVLWIAWNAHAHGDPFHFHARVSAYRNALGATAALGSYPLALAIELVPILIVAAIAVVVWIKMRGQSPARSWLAPLLASLFMLAALVAAEARGGAPTHHPERAVLAIMLVTWFAAIDLLDRATERLRPSLWLAAALAMLVIVSGVRLHAMLPGYGVDRRAELEVGGWLAGHVPAGDRVVIEPSDYGYFAIMAASGRPEMLSVTRSLDPRKKDEPAVIPPDAKWVVKRQEGAWQVVQR